MMWSESSSTPLKHVIEGGAWVVDMVFPVDVSSFTTFLSSQQNILTVK